MEQQSQAEAKQTLEPKAAQEGGSESVLFFLDF